MADYRKTLQQLHDEWATCTRCELGVNRDKVEGHFVFGEGERGGIMFVGEGPGAAEEEKGRPFVGDSGDLLREMLKKAKIGRYYITNVVACRSSMHAHNSEGQPMYTRQQKKVVIDCEPNVKQVAACLPRLYEEIYLVDPLVVVSLGEAATKTLLGGQALSIVDQSGKERTVDIPGAWRAPVLTDKRKLWDHRVRGELVMPTVQTRVDYLLLPTVRPAYALRYIEDRKPGSPMRLLAEAIKRAASIYNRYTIEVYGQPARESVEQSEGDGTSWEDEWT
jgi:uracil-DNA glycosylase